MAAAEARRFVRPDPADPSIASSYGYAYQFDATRFGPYLRDFATTRGVTRIEATVQSVERDAASGDIAVLTLADERRVAGDLFVDCSGFRSLLLGGTLGEA